MLLVNYRIFKALGIGLGIIALIALNALNTLTSIQFLILTNSILTYFLNALDSFFNALG